MLLVTIAGLLFCVGLMVAQVQVMKGQTKYWSNCLIEAVRAWLEDPQGTQILYCPATWNEVFCPHWMWKTKDGLEYEFYTNGKLQPWQYFWHQGSIKVYKRCTYGNFIKMKIAEKCHGGKWPDNRNDMTD